MTMEKKIKIGIVCLVIGIVVVGGLWLWSSQPTQQVKVDCSNIYFEMGAGDEAGPPANAEEQKRLCENRLKDFIQVMCSKEIGKDSVWYDEWQRYKNINLIDRDCKFIKASSVKERKSGNFVFGYDWTCYFDCCSQKTKVIDNEKYCEKDSDCVFLDFIRCCPPPDPCKRESPNVVNKESKEKIEQEMKAKCPPTCPYYSPPQCSHCLNLEKFTPICVDNKCTVKREINCEEYCKAIAKNESEPCPWISNSDLITEENSKQCGCKAKPSIIECDLEDIRDSKKFESLVVMQAMQKNITDEMKLFLYFDHELNNDEIQEIEQLRVTIYKDSWIPPMENHPLGFYSAKSKVEDLCRLVNLDLVKRVASGERLLYPTTE